MISRVPGGHATLVFTGPNVGSEGLTLEGDVKIREPGVAYSRKDDVQSTEAKLMGKLRAGELKVTATTDRNLDWLPRVLAERCEIRFVNKRVVSLSGVVLTQGDDTPEMNYTQGNTEELTFTFSAIAKVQPE